MFSCQSYGAVFLTGPLKKKKKRISLYIFLWGGMKASHYFSPFVYHLLGTWETPGGRDATQQPTEGALAGVAVVRTRYKVMKCVS